MSCGSVQTKMRTEPGSISGPPRARDEACRRRSAQERGRGSRSEPRTGNSRSGAGAVVISTNGNGARCVDSADGASSLAAATSNGAGGLLRRDLLGQLFSAKAAVTPTVDSL